MISCIALRLVLLGWLGVITALQWGCVLLEQMYGGVMRLIHGAKSRLGISDTALRLGLLKR